MSKARTLADAVAAGGALRLAELATNGTNTVGLSAPNALAADVTWKLPNADGTNGQALITDGAGNLSWGAGGGGGSAISVSDEGTLLTAGVTSFNFTGAGVTATAVGNAVTVNAPPDLTWQAVQTTGFTAVAGRAYPCNTTSAAFTVTLPASPAAGNVITLTDYAGTWATNNLTINPNGGKINGSTNNFVLNATRFSAQFVYVDSTQGWLMYSTSNLSNLTPLAVDYLVVAGGGGGGRGYVSGGGGAGGYRTGTGLSVTAGTAYTVTVGAGGATGGSLGSVGASGGNSVFSTITSAGGGGGGFFGGGSSTGAGVSGGSGGGGSWGTGGGSGNTPSTAPSQGNNGGSGTSASPAAGGGGGGGAAATGGNGSSSSGGAGGNGTASSISGSSVTYAGGGGGGGDTVGSGGAGGSGGGGSGGPRDTAGTAGSPNTGGGGGGAGGGASPSGYLGGAGGSGVVIISYPALFAPAAATTGSPTVTISGGNRIYTFTGNGTITF